MVDSLPPPAQTVLMQHKELFFVPLALVVVNDDSARCKKMAAIAIKALLSRLSPDHQNALYDLVNTWLTAEKVTSFSRSALLGFDSSSTGFFSNIDDVAFSLRPACGASGLRSAACTWRWSRRTSAGAWKACCPYWRRRRTRTTMNM